MIQLGLCGWPLDHSWSPRLHAAAFLAAGLEGEYSLYPIAPQEVQELKGLMQRVRTGELQGMNITVPHKQTVIPLLDELTPLARKVGAVNTISREDGRLVGHNTDVNGFLTAFQDLFEARPTRQDLPSAGPNRKALVLGAGGAARAVIFALLTLGWKVMVASRRPEQSKSLLDQFPDFASQFSMLDYDPASFLPILSTIELVVNTTPLGMEPEAGASPWPGDLRLPPRATVYDLVYNPRETRLVRQARQAGLHAANGDGMLVEQAALAFEIWTGRRPPRPPMYSALEDA